MGGVEELMSDVDKRVVQMDFDNKKFERNVKESTESIGKLKKSLNFDGVSNSIDQVSVKIKALEVVTTTALVNITNRVVNLGIQMIKSLSVDNISAGWTKYGQKTTSVATMMAQNFKVAGKELTDTSEKMNVVTDQLERLNWFSDETSYTFTDMVDNVGKFIAAGQDLDVSVKAMEGIATWAALSGQNASTASRAMYQLSQAMGKGKIQLIDYKSIQNANMDTVEFRQTILDAAIALGQLTKEGDKFVTKTGKKFTQNQFAEELSSGWFTSEVLVKGLSKYSAAVEQIYELANKEGITASEVIEKYGDDLDTFGLKAFKAAQEARTFADVLSSVKDAVSSKWMTTSELIFGDKNESVSLWTDLSNALYEVFAESGNFRNEILKVWKSLSGREDLFKHGGDDQGAFWNIYDAIVNLKDLIKSAWNTIFPLSEMEDESAQAQDIGNKLKTLTGNLRAFTKRLQMSEATSLRLRKIFEGLFSVLKSFLTILKAIRYILDPVIELGKQLITAVIDKLISLFGRININGNKFIKLSNKLHDALEKLFDATIDFSGIFKTIIKTLKAFINALSNVFKKISEFIKSTGVIEKITTSLTDFWNSFINAAKDFGKIFKNTISKVFNSMNSLFDKTAKKMQKLSPIFDKVKSSFQGFIDVVKKVPSTISNFVKSLFGSKIAENIESKVLRPTTKSLKKFSKAIEDVKDSASADVENKKKELSPIEELFSGIGKLFAGIGILLQSLVVVIGRVIGMIGQVLGYLGTIIELAYKGELKIEEWQKWLIGISIGLGIIATLTSLLVTKAYNIFYSLLAIVKPIGVLVDSLSGLIDKTALKMMGRFIESIGYTILQISISLMIIAGIDSNKLGPAVATMAGIAAIIGGVLAAVLIIQKKTRQISTALTVVEGTASTVKGGISGLVSQIKGSTSEAKKLNNIRSLALVIQNFGTAMVKIALALYIIGQLDWPDLGKGLIVMGATLTELLLLAKFTNAKEVDIKKAIPGTIQMIALAVLIQSFGAILKSFVGLDETGLKNVTVAFALVSGFLIAAFGMLSLLNYITQQEGDTKSSSKVIGQLAAMSLLIFSFGVTVRMLAGIEWQKLVFVIGVITAFLYAFAGLSAALAASQLISGGIVANFDIIAEMLSMSLLLFSFGVSVRVLASIEWDKLYQIISAIAIFFTEFAALTLGLQYIAKLTNGVDASNIIKQMLSMSLLLFTFAVTARMLADIEWDKLYKIVGAIAIFFGAFAALETFLALGRKISYGSEVATTNMLAMSLLLFSFGVTTRMLADIEWNKLYQIVGVIALFFVSFGAMELLISAAGRISKGVESATTQLLAMSLLLFSFGITTRMLADIEWQNILTAAGAIVSVMLAFGRMIAIMNVAKGKTDTKSVIATIIAMSLSLIVIGRVIQGLAQFTWDKLITPILGINSVLLTFILVSKMLSESAKNIKNATASAILLGALSAVLVAFGASMLMVAKVPWQNILASIGALSLLLVAILGVEAGLAAIKKSGVDIFIDMAGIALSVIALSAALLIMVNVFKQFEEISWESIGKGAAAGAIVSVMLAFGRMIAIMNVAKGKTDTKSVIATIIAMSLSLIVIGRVIQGLAQFTWDKLITPILGINSVLLTFILVSKMLSESAKNIKNATASAILLGALSAVLVAFGASMLMVAKVPWQNILASIGALSLLLVAILGVEAGLAAIKKSGVDIFIDMAGIALSVIALSAALLIMVNVFKQFEEISWESIGKGAAVVAGSFILLGAASAILSPIIGVILLLSSSIVLLGAGMAISATSILLVIHALQELSAMSAVSIQATTDSLNALAELIATALLAGLQSLFDGIGDLLPSLFNDINEFLDEIITLLGDKIPTIIMLALGLLDTFLNTFEEHSKSMFDSFWKIVGNFFSSLEKDGTAKNIANKILNVLEQVNGVLKERADDIVDVLFGLMQAISASLKNHKQLIGDIVSDIFEFIGHVIGQLLLGVAKLAGTLAKFILAMIAVSFSIVIASLGTLSKLLTVFIGTFLLLIGKTFIGLTRVIKEVIKLIVKEALQLIVDVIIDMQDAFAVIGKLIMQLIARGLISVIQAGFGWLFDVIDQIFGTNISESLQNASDAIAQSARDTVNQLSGSIDNVKNAIKHASDDITDIVDFAVEESNSALTTGFQQINTAVAKNTEVLGQSIGDGMKKGISDSSDGTNAAVGDLADNMIDIAKDNLGIHSPSRVFHQIGEYLVQGFANGVSDNTNISEDAMTEMVTQAINATQDTIENQNGDDLTLKVGLDISGVEAQSRKITDIMSGINNVEATAYGRNALYTAKRLNKRTSSEDKTVTQDDHSSTVTYNNVFNVNSTDPERSAEEIDKALSRQAARARLARGAV